MGLLVLACAAFASMRPAAAHPKMDCASCHTAKSNAIDTAQVWSRWSKTMADQPISVTSPMYNSKTMDAQVGSLDGSSQMCLSCHDGSDPRVSRGHTFGPGSAMGDLNASHPVSFVYDSALAAIDGKLVHPSTLEPGVLDEQSKMQCTSCHQVHDPAQAQGSLRWEYNLRRPQTTAQFCRHCHIR
jgi:hypothetical protein